MLKTVLAGTTALVIAGASLAYAQQPPRGPRGDHWRPSAEDISAFTDARIAGLKAGLKLTPDQEKNWPAVETALRDLAKQRAERAQARADMRAAGPKDDAKAGDAKSGEAKPGDMKAGEQRNPIERLRQRADRMTETGTALKKLADAAAPLYQSLNEGQKHRFMMLARIGARDAMGRGFERHRHGGHGWRHHGRGGMGEGMGEGMGHGMGRGMDRGMGPDGGSGGQRL